MASRALANPALPTRCREQVTSEGSLLFEARCSPYHQHSALYPLIEVLQRTLLLTRQDTDDEKVQKLERALTLYNMQEIVAALYCAALLTDSTAVSATESHTAEAERADAASVAAIVVAQAERQATVSVWEDLHWADPSSLEFLTLLIEQIPTTKLLLVLTFRPNSPRRGSRARISPNSCSIGWAEASRSDDRESDSGRKQLSAEVIEQIRIKTDGVPLFVEELTKSVVESAGRRRGQRPCCRPYNAGDSRDVTRSAAGPAGSLVFRTTDCATRSDVGTRVFV